MPAIFQQNLCLLSLGCISGFILGAFEWREVERRSNELSVNEDRNDYVEINLEELEDLQKERLRLQEEYLFKKVRIFCWIMTTKNNYESKAPFPMKTWGRHCNKLIYVSDSDGNGKLDVLNANVTTAGRGGLWHKVQAAFKHIHKTYRGEYDWVMKADEDTYVHMSNLRLFLHGHNAKASIHLGERWWKPSFEFISPSFMLGGAGYLLSAGAVDVLAKQLHDPRNDSVTGCRRSIPTSEEEPMLSECLHQKAIFVDTRDEHGLNTFHQYGIPTVMMYVQRSHYHKWLFGKFQYWLSNADNTKSCCTNLLKSYHYMKPARMFQLEFLIRVVNPFDVSRLMEPKNWRAKNNSTAQSLAP